MSAPVAQLDRVADFESVGRGFEPLRARHLILVLNPSFLGFFLLGLLWGVVLSLNRLSRKNRGKKFVKNQEFRC